MAYAVSMMHRICYLVALCLLAAFLAACQGARSGVSGQSLVRTAYPRVSITATGTLVLQGHGRKWVSLPTDVMGMEPSGIMDYAVYGEGDQGPVTRHAHALVVRPSSEYAWYFQPESYPAPGGFAIGRETVNDSRWVTQLLRVDGHKDWFSAMWVEAGRDVPEFWLARRFSATPERATRVVAEYREPWPECLDPGVQSLIFVREACLEGFLERADAAFTLNLRAADIPPETPAPESLLPRPSFAPDMKRLAGEVLQEETFFRRWR